MKKTILGTITTVILAISILSNVSFAKTNFSPTGVIKNDHTTAYRLTDSSFRDSMHYSVFFPETAAQGTSTPYRVSLAEGQSMPPDGDTNLVTYTSFDGRYASTFQFVYNAKSKNFEITSLTPGCAVEGTTLEMISSDNKSNKK